MSIFYFKTCNSVVCVAEMLLSVGQTVLFTHLVFVGFACTTVQRHNAVTYCTGILNKYEIVCFGE